MGHDPHIRFGIRGHEIGLRTSQHSDRSDHIPTPRELTESARYSWRSRPKFDYTPSERLTFELLSQHGHLQRRWSDGKRDRLDTKLAEILYEMELASDAAERARIDAERLRAQRIREHEAAVERAKVRLVEAHRAEVLNAQVAASLHTQRLTTYLDALSAAIGYAEDRAWAVAAVEWLAWARGHATRTDPLHGPLTMPDDPPATALAFQPFMPTGLAAHQYWR